MKNPFPGMNPYLEAVDWSGVHARLTVYIADQLQDQLPAGLVARPEEQVLIGVEGKQKLLRPDVQVQEDQTLREPIAAFGSSNDPVLVPSDPVIVSIGDPEKDRWVEIRERRGPLVTVVEVLSPTNKNRGKVDYQDRQRSYIAAGVNLVEIDLLREGDWVVCMPAPEVSSPPNRHYKACVFRASHSRQREFYPINLWERLPAIRVPLRSNDPDSVLDLQSAVDQVYERGRYDCDIRYDLPPSPPLNPEDQTRADALLRQAGLRQ